MNKVNCKNCSNEFKGNFCNNCGQSSNVQRINQKYLKNSIADDVFQINHGFLYTSKILLLRPGQSLNDFFLGKRKNFYKPFAFLLISISIYLLSTKLFGNQTFVDEFLGGIRVGLISRSDVSADFRALDFFKKNQTIIFLFAVPLFTIASFMSYRKSRYNFSEHLILNLYITGEQLLIYSLFSFFIDQDSELIFIPLILGFLFNIYVYNQFFNKINWFMRNLKFVVAYFIYCALVIITLFIILIMTIKIV
jgi:hypothetical protein